MNGKKVLLLSPPMNNYGFGKKWEETETLIPPLGLLYLAEPLIKSGYNVDFIDLNVEKFEKQEFFRKVRKKDFILITCMTGSFNNTKKLIKDIKEVNDDVKIVCGGPHCSISKEKIEGSDYTLIGDGENIISDLLDSIQNNKSLKKIPGLIYKKNNKWIKNPGFSTAKKIDENKPYLKLAGNKNYGRIGGTELSIAPLLTSRGCPYRCKYCTFKLNKYRERSVESVFKEIKELEKEGYEYIFICDDNFLLNKKRVHKIMDKVIKQDIGLKFIIQARVDTVDYELYKKLQEAGVIAMLLGIESANQDVLNFYNKQITVEQIKNCVNTANDLGIITLGFMMFGAPMETIKHYKKNKKFFSNIPLDFTKAGILNYVFGTRLWNEANKKGLIKDDEISVMACKKRGLSNFSYEELEEIKNNFVKDFYSNPKRLFRIFHKSLKHGILLNIIKILLSNTLLQYSTNPWKYSKDKVTKNK